MRILLVTRTVSRENLRNQKSVIARVKAISRVGSVSLLEKLIKKMMNSWSVGPMSYMYELDV